MWGSAEKGWALLGNAVGLVGQAYSADQVFESWVGAQGVEAGVDFQVDEAYVVGLVGFFEPLEGFLFFAQAGVDQGDFVAAYSVFADLVLEAGDGSHGFGGLARAGVGVA